MIDDPDQAPAGEVTFDAMSDSQLAELLEAIEQALYARGWRPQRTWSKPSPQAEVEG